MDMFCACQVLHYANLTRLARGPETLDSTGCGSIQKGTRGLADFSHWDPAVHGIGSKIFMSDADHENVRYSRSSSVIYRL